MKTHLDQITDTDILFEDNHLLAINKRASQIVQGDKTGDVPLSEMAKNYIRKKYAKPGEVFLGVIHRLDRPVSGVVLFARTSKALSRMNEQFRERKIRKTYWAVVRGCPDKNEGTLRDYLRKNEAANRSVVVKCETAGSLLAELSYKVLHRAERFSLLEILPLTGKHHQIRVQLSAMGFPIAGDVKYGDKRANDDRSICLHAKKLEFIHPVSKIEMKIEAPSPDQKLWNIFK